MFDRQNTETPNEHRRVRRIRYAEDLESVRDYVREHPEATVRETMAACGFSSTSQVHRLLKEVRADLCVCPTCGGRGSIRTSGPLPGATRSEPE